VILATYATVPLVRDFMEVTIFAKSSSFSALERWVVVYIDFQYFLKYPFLGLGWGSAPTHDTIAGILSNCGLLGLISFATLIGWIIRRLWNQLNPHASSPFVGVISGAMFLSICCTMVAYLCSSLPGGGVFYLISGLAIAACGLGSNSSPEDRQVTIINKT
jgi:O-antigen ligase